LIASELQCTEIPMDEDFAVLSKCWAVGSLPADSRGLLPINAVIYAELAAYASSKEALEAETAAAGLVMREIPRDAMFLAGRAHAVCRTRGGTRAGVLADFLEGAHAAVSQIPILTRDVTRFRAYFPTVRLVDPV
jgi:hypothetical protein